MKLLFADFVSPEEHTKKELGEFDPREFDPITRHHRKWWDVLIEQVINSAIVGGIAGLSALSASPEAGWKTAVIAFGLTFLIELRKYRKL